MAHFLTTLLKKPVLRVFALSLALTVAMPSPAHALRKQQVQDSPPAAALLLSGMEEAGPYQAYRIPYTNTGAASQEVPTSVKGKAVYSGFAFFDTAKSSQARGALVLLIDFQRFVNGHFPGNKHQQDRNYVEKMTQRFFFGNAPDIQAIVFYNAPERVMEGIGGLWAIYQFNNSFKSEQNWLVQKMLWAIPGSIRVPDQLTVSLQVEVADLNTATVSVGSSAGLEEPQPEPEPGPRFNRRTLLRWAGAATAAGFGAGWWAWQSRERFLEPEEVPEPWKQLFEPNEGAKPLPFLGEDYFRFQISSLHLDAGYRAFDRDGKELGSTDATTRGDYQRIVDPRTGATLGYYRMPVQWSGLFGIERFVLSDSSGGDLMTVSVYPYVQKGAVLTKGIPPTAMEGVPPEWRDPARLKTESTRPIYRVFEDEKHQANRVEMIGYVETAADRPGRLLDAAKRPIARLEPVQIIYAGQSPQMLQPLDTALASQPGNKRYFAEAPSEKLAEELSGALERFQPVTLDGRKGKLQLAHRWVQLQVLLGKRTVAVDPKKAQETGEALVKWSTAELEDFKNPEVRRLLWDAIANFHPWFAMAREAVRHLGWEEDPEVLRYVLSQIQQWWIELENPKRNALRDANGWMTDLTKDILEEVLLYNGFQSLEDVTDGFKTFLGGSARLSREFLYIDQPKGSDPALVPLSLMQARLKGFRDVSDVQILLHQAVALQRLGYQVSFLSYVPVANGLEKEEPVKTLSHEWVIMATHSDHQNEAILFSTHREFLKRFGEEISPGVTRVTRERILETNQTLPPGFYLSMEEYSLFPLDASAYLKARDQALKRRKAVSSAELLGPGLGLAVESEGEFYQQFEQDLASAYVRAMAERFDEIVKETGIKVVTSGLTGSELEVRKAGYGAALGLIPRKLIKDLEKIVFLRETKIVPSREARVENGRVIWENVDLEAEGTYSGKTIESVKGVSTPVHEIVHHWDVHVTNQVHDWRGDLSELFHQISWQRNNGQGSWALRKTTDVDMRDFADRGHGLANEKEDIAVNGEQYLMNGAAFRSEARIAMSGGNYAPAVKYLFAKYLLFLDTDGTSFEYSVGSGSPALTWDEVAAAIRTDSEGLNPKPEAKRLGALVEQMREVWQKQRESGKIVQRAAEAPLLAAAGVEETVSESKSWPLRYDPIDMANRLLDRLLDPALVLPKKVLSAEGVLTLNPTQASRLLQGKPTSFTLHWDPQTGLNPITGRENRLMAGLTAAFQAAFSVQPPEQDSLQELWDKGQRLSARSEEPIRQIVIKLRERAAPPRQAHQPAERQPTRTIYPEPAAVKEIRSIDQAREILANSRQSWSNRFLAVEFLLRDPIGNLVTVRQLVDLLEHYQQQVIKSGLVPFSRFLADAMERHADDPRLFWAEVLPVVREAEKKPAKEVGPSLVRMRKASAPAESFTTAGPATGALAGGLEEEPLEEEDAPPGVPIMSGTPLTPAEWVRYLTISVGRSVEDSLHPLTVIVHDSAETFEFEVAPEEIPDQPGLAAFDFLEDRMTWGFSEIGISPDSPDRWTVTQKEQENTREFYFQRHEPKAEPVDPSDEELERVVRDLRTGTAEAQQTAGGKVREWIVAALEPGKPRKSFLPPQNTELNWSARYRQLRAAVTETDTFIQQIERTEELTGRLFGEALQQEVRLDKHSETWAVIKDWLHDRLQLNEVGELMSLAVRLQDDVSFERWVGPEAREARKRNAGELMKEIFGLRHRAIGIEGRFERLMKLAIGHSDAPPKAGLEESRNSRGLGEKTRPNDEHDAFGADQWRKELPPKGKPTKLLPEQTTSSHSPFLVGASRQASDTQITMPTTNTVLNPTESFPKISPAKAPANRILEKSASVFDRTSRLPSVSIGFPTTSNITHYSGAINAAGVEEGAVEMDASAAAEYVVYALEGRQASRISFPPNAGQAYIRELHKGGTLVPKFEELLRAAKTSVITVFPEGTRQVEFSSRMFELMNQNSGHTAGLVRFNDVFWATRISNWTPHLWENPSVGRANGVRILPFPAREGVSVAIDLVSADSTQSMVTFLVRPDPGIAAYPADFWKETLARVREGDGFSSLQAEGILRRRFDEFARRLKGDQPLEIQLRWGEKMVLVDQRKPNDLDWKVLAEVTLILVPRHENDGIGISVEAFPDVATKLFYPNKRGPRSNSTAGIEEGRGFVLVEGVGMLAPSDFPENSYYAVAMGMEQAATLIAAGRAPGRIIAVAASPEEVKELSALEIPGDQIVRASEWPTLAAARDYAVRLGREWLAGLGGLQVSVLEVTARSLQGILAQLREMLPSAWQTDRPISAEDAQNVLANSV